MLTRMRNLVCAKSGLAGMTKKISKHIDALKTTETGKKVRRLDARVGHSVSRLKAAVWFAATVPALAIGYLAWASTDGWIEVVLVGVAAAAFSWCAWRGLSHMLRPRTASEILVEELEDRAKPARWALTGLRAITGVRRATAD